MTKYDNEIEKYFPAFICPWSPDVPPGVPRVIFLPPGVLGGGVGAFPGSLLLHNVLSDKKDKTLLKTTKLAPLPSFPDLSWLQLWLVFFGIT